MSLNVEMIRVGEIGDGNCDVFISRSQWKNLRRVFESGDRDYKKIAQNSKVGKFVIINLFKKWEEVAQFSAQKDQ